MNKATVFSLALVFITASLAHAQQWNATGDNHTTGRVMIDAGGTSTTNDDIAIYKSKTTAGMTIFNANLTGRSVVLVGYDYGGKSGSLTHLGSSYNPGAGYTQTHRSASTVLAGSDVNGLGLISVGDIRFNTGGDDDTKFRMIINSVGNVGIGNSTPAEKFHVNGNIAIEPDNASTPKYLVFRRASDGWIAARIGQRYSMANWAGDLIFETNIGTGSLDLQERMRISYNGNVGIGTTNPNQKLTVNGTIYGKEVKVDLSVPGPDYVFEKGYKLQSLSELEGYLAQNKHLPEVPSAKEMEANGINLSEMNMLLLKKVEELTLHLIEMKKENEKQDRMIQQLLDKER